MLHPEAATSEATIPEDVKRVIALLLAGVLPFGVSKALAETQPLRLVQKPGLRWKPKFFDSKMARRVRTRT